MIAIKLQEKSKSTIREYWNERLPQVWYSQYEPMTLQWYNELERERYTTYYSYLPDVAEFGTHAGERVLEIGVGVGTDLVSFAKGGARVSGIDLTDSAIETTRCNLEMRGLTYETLTTGDAEALPFDDESYDLVYSFGVLHHTPRLDIALQEVRRVLKPHGKAIIMLYARGWKHYIKRVFINGLLRGQLLKYQYSELVNRTTEVHGNSPLTYVLTKRQVFDVFRCFEQIEITQHRLGEYFDYAPYGTRKFPSFVKNSLYILGAENFMGENYIIKARREPFTGEKVSFFQTLLKP